MKREFFEKEELVSCLSIITGVGTSVVAIGVLFTALHWPAAHYIVIMGLFTLALMCFVWIFSLPKLSPFTKKLQELNGTEAGKWLSCCRMLGIIALVSIMVFSVGAIFKMYHFPGASMMITIGCYTLAVCSICIPFSFIKYRRLVNQNNQN